MKKIGKANLVFRNIVLICLLVLVSVIFLESCLCREKYFLLNDKRNVALCIVPGVILFSGALLLLFNRIDKIKHYNEKKVICVLWGMILVLQTVILYFLIKDGFKGITDTSRVINEAIAMVDTQNGLINNEAVYFARYGNNYPFTILIYYICKIVRFCGFRCYTAVLMVLNVILIDLSGVFALKTVKMLRGNIAGIKFLFLFLFSPTTYTWIIFTYTNTFSMPFIMGVLYYGIKAMRREENRMRNIMLAAVWGAVGYQIRATSIIPLIAVMIGILLTARIRSGKEKRIMILLVTGIFVGTMLVSSYICREHLVNREQGRTFPFTHWVMMGLNIQESGFFNNTDVKFSASKPTKQEKIKGNLKKIRERWLEMGPTGYALLVARKMKAVWGSGVDGCLRFHTNGENISEIHQYIYGDKSGVFAIYCQVFRSVTFLFVLFSVFIQICRKGVEEFFVISLTVLGAILFYVLWEANCKYNICFMPLLYILMGDGITRVLVLARKAENVHRYTQKKCCRWGIRLVFLLVPLSISILMVADYSYYIQKKSGYHKAVISDVSRSEENLVLKKKGDVAEQTFTTDRQFNEVCIMSKNKRIDKDSYRFQLLDDNENPIQIQNISVKETLTTKQNWIILHLDKIPAATNAKRYTIRVVCLKDEKKGISLAVTPFDAYDLYTGGTLMVNSNLSQRDMAFCVACREEESLIGLGGYVMFGLAVWVLSGVLSLLFYRYLAQRHHASLSSQI